MLSGGGRGQGDISAGAATGYEQAGKAGNDNGNCHSFSDGHGNLAIDQHRRMQVPIMDRVLWVFSLVCHHSLTYPKDRPHHCAASRRC
jgi:hypothetical protein